MEEPQNTPKQWQKRPRTVVKREWHEKPAVRINNEVNINDFVQRLEAAFQRDLTVLEACDQVGLAKSTYYDHLKKDPEFRERMEKAKRFSVALAKNRVMTIIEKGNDRDAGPMARWLLEKRQPEIYAPTKPEGGVSNTQNNFIIFNNEQLSVLTKQPDIINGDPSELLEALETAPVVDARPEEEGTT